MITFFATFISGITGAGTGRSRLAALVLTGIIILAGVGLIFHFCSKRELQNEVERQKEARSQESQIRIDDAKKDTAESANSSARSLENVRRTENANFGNTNLSEAQRLRCRAFPERCS